MTKAKLNVKFPCGYEYTISISTIFGEIKQEGLPDRCPLHGKKCVLSEDSE